MITRRRLLLGTVLGAGVIAAAIPWAPATEADEAPSTFPVSFSEAEWHRRLTADQFAVLRRSGTERPFTSSLLDEHRRGIFACAGCDGGVFASETKFDSGTGWPSFWAPIAGAVGQQEDRSFGMVRSAVHCSRCAGHLGHVFDDGPKPTGLRYCMNGLALAFKPAAA